MLERYFEARTTDAEEQELKAYFREGETDPGLRYARAMFCGMDGLSTPTTTTRSCATLICISARARMSRSSGLPAAARQRCAT